MRPRFTSAFLNFYWSKLSKRLPLFVIKSLIFDSQDYHRKVSICVKELAKNELISISGW